MAERNAIYPTVPDPSVPVARTSNYGDARSCKSLDAKTGKMRDVRNCRATPFHPGIDLIPTAPWWDTHKSAAGFPVFAPFDGWILYSGPVPNPKDDDISAWLADYGPGVVILAHDDQPDAALYDPGENVDWSRVRSWRYSLIAHIKPVFDIALSPDVRLLQRARFGSGKIDESKWLPGVLTNAGASKHLSDLMLFAPEPDSSAVLKGGRHVTAGTLLGEMTAAMGHTHWEIRTTPFASPGPLDGGKVAQGNATPTQIAAQQRIDPNAWMSHYVNIAALPPQQQVEPPAPSSDDSGWGWLILAYLGYEATK